MSRLEKKCFLASSLMHALCLVLLVSSVAFVSPSHKSRELQTMRVVPTKFIDQALAGGGGNPRIAPNEGQQRGQTIVPPPPTPAPTPPVRTPPPATPPPATPPPPRVTPRRPDHVTPPRDTSTPNNTSPSRPTAAPLVLKPIVRRDEDREAAKAAAEAKERAAAGQKAANQLVKTIDRLKAGFEHGTVVEASGPGGEPYTDYAFWVKQKYEDAWFAPDDLEDEHATAVVSVTIARSGDVMVARIEKRSGVTSLDRSVQRALDKVKFIAPFPEGSKDGQRTFTINFNLKAKNGLG